MTTSRCREIQAQAAGLASLAPDDPERRSAEAHALTCAACAAALAEARAIMSLVDEALPPTPPRPEALERARREILAELGAEAHPTPPARAQRSGARGRISAAAAVALTIPPLLAVVLAFFQGGPAGLQPAVGATCAALELPFALVPLAAAWLLARRRRAGNPAIAVGVSAAIGALAGQAVLHTACHALPSTSHALVFHTLPVLLALALGALVGQGVSRSLAAR